MGRTAPPLSEEELAFVRASYAELGPTECARRLGRSRQTVYRVARAEGLRKAEARPPEPDRPPPRAPDRRADGPATSERLHELRDRLHDALLAAEPKEIAGIARVYLATLESIDRTEGGADDEGTLALDAIGRSVARHMPG